ncbi:RIP metalloprotease RseP [Thermicanus aegyptius]|uniref:RIP metalloprotease RseP n=1 Tax=Thermicanus aegyptius TaxID=94009 RepID=UPI00041B39FF|nr:RIP metalloprotease RseP [Thermicanus aegyptius]
MTWIVGNAQTIFSIIVVFGLLIFVHELGHFLLAKRAGILVREFAIGFGPKLFSFKRDETKWTIRLLPLGGYVRMAGEDPEVVEVKPGQRIRILENEAGEITHFLLDEESMPGEGKEVVASSIDVERRLRFVAQLGEAEKEFAVSPQAEMVRNGEGFQIAPLNRQFGSKTVGQRFWTLTAGPLANFILAIFLFILLAAMTGVDTDEPVVGGIAPGFPAEAAGLRPNDRILSIDDTPIHSWTEVQQAINQKAGKEITILLERNKEQRQAKITPAPFLYIASLSDTNQIDLVPGDEVVAINGKPAASLATANRLLEESAGKPVVITVNRVENGVNVKRDFTYDLGKGTLQLGEIGRIGISQKRDFSVGKILLSGPVETWNWTVRIVTSLGQLFHTPDPLNQMGGPVAIFKITGDAANRGFSTLVFWAALLSINLGIFNLLPIPALDGGRLLFLLIEAVRGKPIDPAKESLVHFIGFAFLMLLILIVTWNDIQKFLL